jgi:hypothetical protein
MIRTFGTGNQTFSEVGFFVTRRDGSIGHYNKHGLWVSRAYRQQYESLSFKAQRFARWLRRHIPLLAVLWLLTRASVQGIHEHLPSLPVLPAATVIVNGGQSVNVNLVGGLGGTSPKWVAWGTGAGTAAITDTTLFTESTDETRTVGTCSSVTSVATNDTLQVQGAITVLTSNKTVTNVGTFDALTLGHLFLKADFAGQPLLVGDSITFTLKDRYS